MTASIRAAAGWIASHTSFLKRTVSTTVFIGGVLILTAGHMYEHFTLPPKNASTLRDVQLEVRSLDIVIDSVYRGQRALSLKLDRALCILGGDPPLRCEQEHSP